MSASSGIRDEPWSLRKVEELPWQLASLQHWDALAELIADTDFLCAPGALSEARRGWAWLAESSPEFRPEIAYRAVIADPQGHARVCDVVARLLCELGLAREALTINSYLLEEARKATEPDVLGDALELHASLLAATNNPTAALEAWCQLSTLARERRDHSMEARSLAGEGRALRQRGDSAGALRAWRQEEQLRRKIGDDPALFACLANCALLQHEQDPEGAVAALRTLSETCRLTDDLDGLRHCLGNLGVLHNLDGKAAKALAVLREEEMICRRFRDDDGLQICLGNQAESQKLLGDYDAALQLLDERARLCRDLQNSEGQEHALLQRADLFRKLGVLSAGRDSITPKAHE
ncbi:MAG: hypothetical protein E6L08_01090 [Verrucomicrobia bacterium]|nr:MAG: hypothetical protein E6L08_01090 [Verrucomicrobiota bacterium]